MKKDWKKKFRDREQKGFGPRGPQGLEDPPALVHHEVQRAQKVREAQRAQEDHAAHRVHHVHHDIHNSNQIYHHHRNPLFLLYIQESDSFSHHSEDELEEDETLDRLLFGFHRISHTPLTTNHHATVTLRVATTALGVAMTSAPTRLRTTPFTLLCMSVTLVTDGFEPS